MSRKTYNRKSFLLPNSHRSMACIHGKVMDDRIMKLTIHDCRESIQLHNDLNDPEQVQEAFEKLENLACEIAKLQNFIAQHFIYNK